MIMKFTLNYNQELDAEQRIIFESIVNETLEEKNYQWKTYTGDITELSRRLSGIRVVLETGEVAVSTFQEVLRRLSKIELALENLGTGNANSFNHKVNVHVPGLALLMIDEVEVLTDECTRSLHDYMQEGWRILAICPQPNQRRPDYVIGRSKARI